MGLFSKKDKKQDVKPASVPTPPAPGTPPPSVPGKMPPPPAPGNAPATPKAPGFAPPPPPGGMPPPPGGVAGKPSFGTPQPNIMSNPTNLDEPVPERKYDIFSENARYIKYDFSKMKIDKLDLSTNPDVRTIRKHVKKLIEVQKQLITMEKDLTCRKAFLDKMIFEEKEDKKPPILEDLLAGKDVKDNTFTIANKDLLEAEQAEKEMHANDSKGAKGKDKASKDEPKGARIPMKEEEILLEGILSK